MKDQNIQVRISWSLQEDNKLKELLTQYTTNRKGWKLTSKAMKMCGYNRSTKACRERYFYHLVSIKKKQQIKSPLTDKELSNLFKQVAVYGNKWSEIAKKMRDRTDLEIKNCFYAHVKKIFRRLIKAAYQTTESTRLTQSIRPILISSIFCNDQESDPKLIPLDCEVKKIFKGFIFDKKKFSISEKLGEQDISKIKLMMDYLEKQKYENFLLNYNLYLNTLKDRRLKSQQSSKIDKGLVQSQRQQDSQFTEEQEHQNQIIMRLRTNKPIFTTTTFPIEKYYLSKAKIENVSSLQINQYSDLCSNPFFGNQNVFSMIQSQLQQNSYPNISLYIATSNSHQQNQWSYNLDSFYSYVNQQQ